MVHDLTVLPSTTTVQAPQWLVSQPTWVPVNPGIPRMKWTSNCLGSTSPSRLRPFILTWIACFFAMSGPLLFLPKSLFSGALVGAGERAARQFFYQAHLVFRWAA